MIWARMLAYITGTVDQELLLRNEYLAAENRILRAQIKGRLLLSDAEKATLAEIAHRLKRKALEELAAVAKPDTLLAWYRKLIANKFDGSKFRKSWGRPRVDEETKRLVVRILAHFASVVLSSSEMLKRFVVPSISGLRSSLVCFSKLFIQPLLQSPQTRPSTKFPATCVRSFTMVSSCEFATAR